MLLANILEKAGLPGNDEILREGDWTPQDSFRTVQRMARNMRKHNFFAVKDGVNELEDLGMHDNDIATALKQVKPEILIWFEHGLAQKSHTNQLIYQIFLLVDLGIEWRELAKLLDDNKDEVIRSILRYLQKNVQDNFVLMHIKGYIERFDKMGIRWPELKTVLNSLTFELKKQDLDEATSEDYPDWFAAIVDYIGDTDIAGAVNMCKTYNVNAKNTPMIANYMESNRWYLLRYLERCLGMSFQGFDELNKDIKGLKYIGVNWPELDTFYDDNKDKVMRLLLQQVKSDDEDAGYYTWQEVNALRQAGVDWPELDIVMKGAMSLMDRKDNQLDEAARISKGPRLIKLGDGNTILNPAHGPGEMTYSGDPEGYVFKDKKAKQEYDKIADALQKAGKKLQYLGAGQSKQPNRDSFVATGPGLVWVYIVGERPGSLTDVTYVKGVPVQTSRFRWEWAGMVKTDRTLNGDKIDAIWSRSRTPDTFLSNIHKLKFDDKKFKKIADRYKDDFLKFIVSHLATFNSYNNRPANSTIEYLTNRGVKWPELSTGWIAEKTIPHLIKILSRSINEALAHRHSTPHPNEAIRALINRFAHDDAAKSVLSTAMTGVKKDLEVFFVDYMINDPRNMEYAVGLMDQLRNLGIVDIGPFDDPAGELEARKDHVLVMLLKKMKTAKDPWDYDSIRGIIGHLRSIGLDWPELKAIEKSLNSVTAARQGNRINEDDDWYDRRLELQQDADNDAYDQKQAAIEAYFSDGLRNISSDLSNLGDLAHTIREMGASDPIVNDLIKADLPIIIEWFEENIASNDADSIMDFMDLLDDADCLDNDEIRQRIGAGLENNKDAIITQILKSIKRGNRGTNGTKMLSKVVDWPELGVILRSMEADAANKRLAEASSNLYPNKIQNIIERGLDNIRHGGAYYIRTLRDELLSQRKMSGQIVADIFNMNKTELIHALANSIRHGDPTDLLSGLHTLTSVLGKPWPEATAVLVKHLPDIKSYITSLVGGSGWGMGYSNAVHLYQYINESGIDDAIIKELKGFIRDRIVTVLKNSIKQHGFGPPAFDGIDALASLKVRVDIGKGAMKDALLSSFAQALSKEGLHRADRFVKTIIRSGDAQLQDEMKKVIEEHKVPIIRNMLGLIRVNAAYSVYPSLTTLQHLGFRWDELRIISKSLKDLAST